MAYKAEWLEISAIKEGLTKNSYGTNTDLKGRELELTFNDGAQVAYKFDAESLIRFEGREVEEAAYKCIKIDNDLYLAFYRQPAYPANQTMLLVDFGTNQVTEFYGQMPTLEEAKIDLITLAFTEKTVTRVKLKYRSASINGAAVKPIERTKELLGYHVRWEYSPEDIYEHIYFNENYYAWQCLEGPEKFLADGDECDYFKLRDKLYLFVWREKLIPTMGFIVCDYRGAPNLQSNGCLFGINTVTGAPEGGDIAGAKGRVMNYTKNPEVM